MKSGKLWYLVALVVLSLLPLAGCGGGKSSAIQNQQGYAVGFKGQVDTSGAKASAKSAAASTDLGTVTVYNAQDGSVLATGPVDSNGKFSNLSFNLPDVKAILVFKAVVTQGTFRTVLPLDLSNPPAAGTIANNQVNLVISQDSTNIASTVSTMLGLSGVLGDTGMTLASVTKTYADAAAQVSSYGGQVLSYTASGLALNGTFSNTSLLPAMDAGTFTNDDLNNMALTGKIISAFVPSKKPIVNFQITNKATGKGVRGLKTFGLHIAQLQPEANGASSYWLNYIVSSSGNTGSDPAVTYNADGSVKTAGYTVIDKGDGTYTAVFATDLTASTAATWNANLTHRIAVTARSIATPGVTATGPINPATGAVNTNFAVPNVAGMVYDFTPATGQMLVDGTGKQTYARDLVTIAACNQCHDKLGFSGGHFASRPDTRICVVCHTSQLRGGEGEFVTFIHRIHMGEVLNEGGSFAPVTGVLLTYNEQTYPQDIRNCALCHKGIDGNNWKVQANRKNCGSCHNATDFAAHEGGQTTDQFCAGCHVGASAFKEVAANHVAVAKPDATVVATGVATGNVNAGWIPAAGMKPAGAASIFYNISSVTRDPATKNPSIKFTMVKNGSKVVFGDYSAANNLRSIMPGFIGAPSAYFVWGTTQDGITAPADFNVSASSWLVNAYYASIGKKTLTGTSAVNLTGPSASGYYTLTLPGVVVPDDAVMLTGGVGYSYSLAATQPLTQIDLPAYPFPYPGMTAAQRIGGLVVVAPNVYKVATGYTGRRVIVDNAKCNKCHTQLGSAPTFHAGQRNDAPSCAWCHTPNKASSGWSANASSFVHGVHGAKKRTTQYGWHAVSSTDGYWKITYPGYLRDCEQCHVAGMYDFSNSAYNGTTYNQAGVAVTGAAKLSDRLLWTTTASGTSAISSTVPPAGVGFSTSTVYGAGFSVNNATGVSTAAAGTTLVTSPVTAACFSCHDSKQAMAHMTSNGGAIYEARSTALTKTEQCLVCHGTASNTLNSTVPTIKAVHRWW